MEAAATRQHAHPNTVYHCLYAYYHLHYSRQTLAHVFCKTEHTIGNWIRKYEATGVSGRASTSKARVFSLEHRTWVYQHYQANPLAYLDETQEAFKRAHGIPISISSVWRIVHGLGLTWKVLERRAMHIKERDVFRFVEELSHVDWSHSSMVFLDEVSFDNRGMVRRRGYALHGKKVAVRGDFQRKPRVSVLAFLGVDGIIDYFNTDGTFDRVEFLQCCRDFVHSQRGGVQQYPGKNSVWILDGATIHRHPEIIHYLRSVGIVAIFLPAYCPFFNPIEFIFGYIKKSFQRHYCEISQRDLLPFVVEIFRRFMKFDMRRVFTKCGWMQQGFFNPVEPLSREQHPSTTSMGATVSRPNEDVQDEFDFTNLN
jgi:transposase